MLERLFGGDNFVALTNALDASTLRQQVIAHNLANANTPGFKRQEVQFENELAKALDRKQNPCGPTNAASVADVRPCVVTTNDTSTRLDGNNVNLEIESVRLAENALHFEVLSQSTSGYFTGLKLVINGGR